MKFFRWLKKIIFKEIFLFYHEIVCCMYLLESTHRCDSNEYTQHAIIVLKIKTITKLSPFASDLASWLTLSGSNYPYFEQISMV